MRKGNAKLYKPEASIGRPGFKALKMLIAVRDWECELCRETIPAGRHYIRYYDRRPLEIDDCPYHFMCWALINLYCLEKGRKRYVNGWVKRWVEETYCKGCRTRCKGIHKCKKIAKAIHFKAQRRNKRRYCLQIRKIALYAGMPRSRASDFV